MNQMNVLGELYKVYLYSATLYAEGLNADV